MRRGLHTDPVVYELAAAGTSVAAAPTAALSTGVLCDQIVLQRHSEKDKYYYVQHLI